MLGVLLVLDGSWTFGPLWIKLGLGAFAFSFLLNVTIRAPLVRRQAKGGAVDPVHAGRLLGRLALVELTVLYLAVADMVSKPSGGDTGTLIGGGLVLALAIAYVAAGTLRAAPHGARS